LITVDRIKNGWRWFSANSKLGGLQKNEKIWTGLSNCCKIKKNSLNSVKKFIKHGIRFGIAN
jgi:hypothetical protein